ncbi:unnamed protein product [Protopolystoma xenopodis]|uniref:Uncharacterized protein n=1 Tax=Protopolystoma xenopodis TaxID=117903 RepID=A0A448WA59_9PLAT|nr:unnamed protein product [Protopolystoma xenopodis]
MPLGEGWPVIGSSVSGAPSGQSDTSWVEFSCGPNAWAASEGRFVPEMNGPAGVVSGGASFSASPAASSQNGAGSFSDPAVISSVRAWPVGQWRHVAIVLSRSGILKTSLCRLYLDGKLVNSQRDMGHIVHLERSSPIWDATLNILNSRLYKNFSTFGMTLHFAGKVGWKEFVLWSHRKPKEDCRVGKAVEFESDQLSIGFTGRFMLTLFPRTSSSDDVHHLMDESSGRFHPKRERKSRGLRQYEYRIKAKRLQYEFHPSSSGEIDQRISSSCAFIRNKGPLNNLNYIGTSASSTSLSGSGGYGGFLTSISAFVGTPACLRRPGSCLRWHQGPFHLIEESLGPAQVAVIHALGPSYVGSFQAVPITPCCDEALLPLVSEERLMFGIYASALSTMTVSRIRKVYNQTDAKAIARQVLNFCHEINLHLLD